MGTAEFYDPIYMRVFNFPDRKGGMVRGFDLETMPFVAYPTFSDRIWHYVLKFRESEPPRLVAWEEMLDVFVVREAVVKREATRKDIAAFSRFLSASEPCLCRLDEVHTTKDPALVFYKPT